MHCGTFHRNLQCNILILRMVSLKRKYPLPNKLKGLQLKMRIASSDKNMCYGTQPNFLSYDDSASWSSLLKFINHFSSPLQLLGLSAQISAWEGEDLSLHIQSTIGERSGTFRGEKFTKTKETFPKGYKQTLPQKWHINHIINIIIYIFHTLFGNNVRY